MKLRLITSLIIFFPIIAFCQMNSSFDFMIGVDNTYRKLSTSSENVAFSSLMETRNKEENSRVNWRVGLNYNKRISHKIVLKTGLRFAWLGYNGAKRTDIRWPSEHDGMGSWSPDPSLPHELQINNEHWFIEIPLIVRYEWAEKKLIPFVELGVSPYYYLKTRIVSISDIGTEVSSIKGSTSNINKVHLAGSLSLGLSYSIMETIQVFGQGIFRYHLTQLNDDLIEERLNNVGFEIGIRKRLN